MRKTDLYAYISQDETVLHDLKPDVWCFILESIFNPLLPFAIVWALFDYAFIHFIPIDDFSGLQWFVIPFMVVHLMPVWLYLGGALFSGLKHRNMHYIITDHAIYTTQGILTKTVQSKSFAELSHIDLHRGIFDQLLGVGDIILTTNQFHGDKADSIVLQDIRDYAEIFALLNKLQKDIHADTMYPNDLRPKENHGYNTKYRG